MVLMASGVTRGQFLPRRFTLAEVNCKLEVPASDFYCGIC